VRLRVKLQDERPAAVVAGQVLPPREREGVGTAAARNELVDERAARAERRGRGERPVRGRAVEVDRYGDGDGYRRCRSGRERQRAEELRSVLIATVPVTYPAVVVLLADDHLSARVVSTRGGQVIRGAALLLRRGPDASYVIATVTVGAERPKEPCADSPPGIWWGSDDACKIVESRAGTAIRYAWTDSPGGAHWYYATHFRSGVAVTVMQGQETATSTAVLSEREMVELTAKLAVGG